MRTFYTGGSLGDTYVIVCKLYSIAKRERILCKHYTRWNAIRPIIREIYSLVPNIAVEFRNNQNHMDVTGQFLQYKPEKKRTVYTSENNMYGLNLECYPKFELEDIGHFELSENYVTLQLQAGVNPKNMRRIGSEGINKILTDSEYPVVIVGNDDVVLSEEKDNVIDLRWRASIKESINIIKHSKHFYGCLGLLNFIALSHRIMSTPYMPRGLRDKKAFRTRIAPIKQWERYIER